jgi:hypothetical protein
MVGRNGAGWVPAYKYLINPNGFGEFQPEPAKIGTKTARIGEGWIGLVGLGGFYPPLLSLSISHS